MGLSKNMNTCKRVCRRNCGTNSRYDNRINLIYIIYCLVFIELNQYDFTFTDYVHIELV